MNSLLLVFSVLVLVLTKQSQGEYEKPQNALPVADLDLQSKNAAQFYTQSFNGNIGKNNEITMPASTKLYAGREPSNQKLYIVQHINQPATGTSGHQPYATTPPVVNSLNENFQQPLNHQQQNSNLNYNQHNGNFANHYNQLTANSHYQQHQQQVTSTQPLPHAPTIITIPRAQQHHPGALRQQQFAALSQTAQQQQRNYPQQYLHINFLPNSNNLLHNLVNNQRYVSQLEASQLDVYPYKQVNGNPRIFTRIISQENVIKNSASKAPKTGLKDRRLFPYCEFVIPKYPNN